jgi:hypothetical protein
MKIALRITLLLIAMACVVVALLALHVEPSWLRHMIGGIAFVALLRWLFPRFNKNDSQQPDREDKPK